MNTTNPAHRKMEWLEAMRGFAAIWVLLHHAKQSVDHFVGDMGARPILANGYLGLSRDPCGIDLIMPLPAPAKGCVASA